MSAPADFARTSASSSLSSPTRIGTHFTSTALSLPARGTLKQHLFSVIKLPYNQI